MRYSDGVHVKGRSSEACFALFTMLILLTILSAPCSAARWSEFIDEGDDEGMDLAALTGGGVIGAGATDGDAWLVKFADDGTVTWEYTYPVGTASVFRGVIENSTGYCAVGEATVSSNVELYAVCVGSNGSVIWQKTYEGEDSDSGYDLAEIGNYIVLVGWTESFDNGTDRDAWVILVEEQDGDIASKYIAQIDDYVRMEYRCGGTGDEQFNTALVTDAGNEEFLLAGSTTSYGQGGDDLWALLRTATLTSTPSWQATYGSSDDETAYASALYGSDIILVGKEDGLGTTGTGIDPWVLKIDSSDGTIDWEYSYNVARSITEVAYDVHYDSSAGSLYVAGWCEEDDIAHADRTSTDMLLLDIDPSNGSLNWSQFYDSDPGSDYTDQGYSVTEDASDGDIYFGGEQVLSVSDRDWWLLKLDSSGDVDSTSTEGVCWFNSAGLAADSTSASTSSPQVPCSQTDADVTDQSTSRNGTSLSRSPVSCP